MKELRDRIAEEHTQDKARVQQLITQLESQLADKPLSIYKETYRDQADKHRHGAWIWLGVSVVLTAGFGALFWWLFHTIMSFPDTVKSVTIIQNLVTKGLLLSLAFLLIHQSIKNFNAHRHLEIINLHRQNALVTVDDFLKVSEEPTTRDAVLVAATNAIFDTNETGYLFRKSGPENINLVEVARGLVPKSGTTGSGN